MTEAPLFRKMICRSVCRSAQYLFVQSSKDCTTPTRRAPQTGSRPRCILRFRRKTSHNANYSNLIALRNDLFAVLSCQFYNNMDSSVLESVIPVRWNLFSLCGLLVLMVEVHGVHPSPVSTHSRRCGRNLGKR